MTLSKTRYVAGALFAAILLAGSAPAQRRVFTNDDVASAPPPAASQPAAAAPAQPAPGAPMSAAEADWRQAMQLQSQLNSIYEQLDVVAEREPDPQRKLQWSEMANSIIH